MRTVCCAHCLRKSVTDARYEGLLLSRWLGCLYCGLFVMESSTEFEHVAKVLEKDQYLDTITCT